MYPIWVHAQTAAGAPLPSLTITFSAAPGVTIFPPTTQTGPAGDARALVNLPDTPFSQFKITATAATSGVTSQFTEFTGPRLLQTFGDASAGNGAVLDDGTFVAEGDGPTGGAVFAPDGALQAYLGSPLRRLSIPDPGATNFILNDHIGATVSPDQKVYIFNYPVNAMFVLDSQMNLVNFLDMGSINLSSPLDNACYLAVAPNGNIFCSGSVVKVYDSQGSEISDVNTGITTSPYGIVASNSNNFVMLVPDSLGGAALNEYDLRGSLVHTVSVPGGRGVARDSAGNYAVGECCLPSVVQWFDQNYNLLRTVNLDIDGNWTGGFYVDDAGNSYLQDGGRIQKFDSSGNSLWYGPGVIGTPLPSYVNGLNGGASAMALDPGSGDAYIQLLETSVAVYSDGLFERQFNGGGQGIAMDTNRNIYSILGSTMRVFDTSGNLLRSRSYSQIHAPSALNIASDNTKFVFDTELAAIHQIDSSDNYVGSIPLNLPTGAAVLQGEAVATPDGNLIAGLSLSYTGGGNGLDTYVKKLSRNGAEVWSIGSTEPGSPLQNLAVDTSGRVYLLRTNRLEILDPAGNPTGQLDLATDGPLSATRVAMSSLGDNIYFCFRDRIYVVSPN